MTTNPNSGFFGKMARQVASRIVQGKEHHLVRNTLWALGGYTSQLLIQGVYFVLIARSLGPAEYGAFVSVIALANVIAPFVGFGTGLVLLRNVARSPESFPRNWGNALIANLASGLFCSVAIALSLGFLLPHAHLTVIICICLSDLVFARLQDVAFWAFQALGNLANKAKLSALLSILRLLGIASLIAVGHGVTATQWSVVYASSSLTVCVIAVAWCWSSHGAPEPHGSIKRDEVVEGLYFCSGLSSQSIYNDIDKTMMARLSSLNATGAYAAAYRVVDTAFLPVRSVLNSAYADFFRHGSKGLSHSAGYGRKLLMYCLPYSLLISVSIYMLAPFAPLLLGHAFADMSNVLRWLAPLPLIKTFHYFAADALTGGGHQKARTMVQGVVAGLNVLLNFWLIPAYGWLGASWASLASDGALALLLWFWIFRCESSPSSQLAPRVELARS